MNHGQKEATHSDELTGSSKWLHSLASLIQVVIGEELARPCHLTLRAAKERIATLPPPITKADRMAATGLLVSLRARADREQRLGEPASRSASPETQSSRHEKGVVQAVLAEIAAKHSKADFRLGDLALSVGLSPSYIDRLLARHTGSTFLRHLRRCRVDHVTQLLRTGLPIKSVAFEAGYTRSSSLDRDFRRVYGVTPTVWRARLQPRAHRTR